ncbi:MAG: hypothetical protein ACXAEX_23355 [Promethearchaeota archaeon]
MYENHLMALKGLAFLLFFTSSILSLIQGDYPSWALYLCLGFMINAADIST